MAGAQGSSAQPRQEQAMASAVSVVHGLEASGSDVEVYAEAPLPTGRGLFRTVVFRQRSSGAEHLAMIMGEVTGPAILTRLHSECLTSEVLGSLKCDCRAQLDRALDLIAARGRGVLLYLRQEGRGIGLGNKIRAYALQAAGADTYQANRALGFAEDLRRYDVAADMLRLLGVRSVQLITNNPLKLAGLREAGVVVRRRVSLPSPANPHNLQYLRTKAEQTGHLITTDGELAARAG
jgi:GTP cyclohydrolase II